MRSGRGGPCGAAFVSSGQKAVGAKRLEVGPPTWEVATVKTLTVDDQQRIRIPGAKPRQKFAYQPESDGTILLKPVKAEAKEPFPRGSLTKYLTPERDEEQLALLKGCVQGPE